ncbi:MAG: DNA-binding protein, partial [Oscillospiraceae bacterium]|nr:DNA-binding protein [Oscillospiraceae bacterium]
MPVAKNMEIPLLFDFYGEILTDKQRDVVSLYYEEDLSLAEIA